MAGRDTSATENEAGLKASADIMWSQQPKPERTAFAQDRCGLNLWKTKWQTAIWPSHSDQGRKEKAAKSAVHYLLRLKRCNQMIGPSSQDIAWLLALFAIVPMTWIVGLICIGARPIRRIAWTGIIVIFYICFAFATCTGGYTLVVQILDPQQQPLPGIVVDYFTYPSSDRFGRFSQAIRGQIKTDTAGRITLHPNHAHSVVVSIRDPRFQYASFNFEGAGKRYGHQLEPQGETGSDREGGFHFIEPPSPPPSTGLSPGTWIIEAQKTHIIIVSVKPKASNK